MKKIRGAIAKSPQLQAFLLDPSQKREQKREAVLSMLQDQSYSEIVRNLFRVIAENGRLPLTTKIVDSFDEIMRAHRREVVVKITAAKELSKDVIDAIKQTVNKRLLSSGQVPHVTISVDSTILGGLIVQVGDKTLDMSVLTRVTALNKALEESVHQ
jgi:F-type H+-transporting ATPase subunit O